MLWMSQKKAVLPSTFFQYYWPPETMQVAKKKVIGKRRGIVNCLATAESNTLELISSLVSLKVARAIYYHRAT